MPTQSTDVFGDPNGITYTAVGQTWKILKGVDVGGTDIGAFSDLADSVLDNSGSLFGGVAGVLFDGEGVASNYVVKNQKKGEIEGGIASVGVTEFGGSAFVQNKGALDGGQYGVYFVEFTGSARLVNKGAVEGGEFGVYTAGSSAVDIENHGDISGSIGGVVLTILVAGSSGSTIDNFGKIDGFQYGIIIQGALGVEAKIVNYEGASIDGALLGIYSTEKLNLKNEGKIDGAVVSSVYDDTIINKGKIADIVVLGEGVDTFKQKGEKAKADLIDTQDGNDLVVLGVKADKLLFDSTLNAATNVDTVKKFVSGKDAIYLDDDIFAAITPGTLSASQFHKGTSAADADDRIIYDKASGALYYDADGSGAGAQVQFARLDGGPKLKASDFTIGEYSLVL